jgi:phosphoribosylformimino-5-aminoimidazole carboxamide ribonucleotide (ProFAR) isomerase
MLAKGSAAVLGKDIIKIMQMLIDIEMKSFLGLNIKTIFLQNIITDLLLGLDAKIFFVEYAEYIKKKYNVLPGFLTMNLPLLLEKLQEWNIQNVVICSSINKIGYLMSPSVEEYEKVLSNYDKSKFQIMAMSIFASGAIKPEAAIDFIGKQKIESVVFGASSKKNIVQSAELLKKYF